VVQVQWLVDPDLPITGSGTYRVGGEVATDQQMKLDLKVEMENPALFANLETQIVVSDQASRIREAMSKLNASQRSVIELAYFEGLSQAEMAEKMGQPLGTIKTWVRTALKNLREHLGVVAPA